MTLQKCDPGSALTDCGGMAGYAWREVTYWEVRGSLALRGSELRWPETWVTDWHRFRPEAEHRLLGAELTNDTAEQQKEKGSLKNKTFISDYIPQNTLNHIDFAVQSVSHWIVHKKT